MSEVLAYIEAHLHDKIEVKDLEKITGTSAYHFRRMFSFVSGMSLGEYIRNRKLSNATFDLLHAGMSVTETALKYNYEYVDGFSRAFIEWSGMNPSEVNEKKNLKSFPKPSFQLTIQGGTSMDYRIEKKKDLKLLV